MALEIVGGAGIGLIIQVIHQSIKKARATSYTAQEILSRLDKTIVRITPLILQIEEIEKDLDESSRKVIEDLNHLLHNIVDVLDDYAKLNHINVLKRHGYKEKIIKLEASLKWMIEVDVQVNQWSDIKRILTKISQNHINVSESSRPKPKIDFHIRWNFNKKEHEMRFGVK